MVEREEATIELLVSHQELTEAVEPAVRHLDDPTPSQLGVGAFDLSGLLSAAFDVCNVAVRFNDGERSFAVVACVGAQMLVAPLRRLDPLDHYGREHRLQLRDIMAVSPGHDERQRDATSVYQ